MKTATLTDTESLLINSLTDEQVEELMADDTLPEYNVDYSKVKPNRFARRENVPNMVRLDADVAAVFQTAEAVNTALRMLTQAMPPVTHHEKV